MASTSRLEQLAKLIQADLDALPDVPQSESVEDDDESGGVPLDEPQLLPPTPDKQSAISLHTEAAPVMAPVESTTEHCFIPVEDVASSSKSGTMQTPTGPPKAAAALPPTVFNRGDLTAAEVHFTPIVALAKYPYKFCNKAHSQDIASAFFDQGKFWDREWDLYYIWDTEPIQPLILVRENQVQDLIKEINDHLKLGLRITDSQREEGLVCRFPDHPACLPRYLGRSHSREQYDSMARNAPKRNFRAAKERSHGPPDSGTLEQFKQMMEDMWQVQKNKSKAKKEKQQLERLDRHKSMVNQLKRAQRYLGLRASEAAGQSTLAAGAPAIDDKLPAPFAFDQSVVFICVDVESYDKAHDKITEIGVATLDTQDLAGVAPGKDGEDWRAKIKARHFRVIEHRNFVNHEFVRGYPDGFEFGESTFVSLKEAPTHVAACFHPPFGVHSSSSAEEEMIEVLQHGLDTNEKRNLVFLGHDTLSDVRYLQHLGYDPLKVENIIEAMDTAKMYQAWRRDTQPTSLGRIMNDFDVVAWKLHNAGNDAVYTVQAMLAICVREATSRGSSELKAMRDQDKADRLAAAQNAAIQRAKDDADGWSDSETAGDGGAPVPLVSL